MRIRIKVDRVIRELVEELMDSYDIDVNPDNNVSVSSIIIETVIYCLAATGYRLPPSFFDDTRAWLYDYVDAKHAINFDTYSEVYYQLMENDDPTLHAVTTMVINSIIPKIEQMISRTCLGMLLEDRLMSIHYSYVTNALHLHLKET